MSPVDEPDGWGPSHQVGPRRRWIARPPVEVAALGAVFMIAGAIHFGAIGVAIALILVLVALVVIDAIIAPALGPVTDPPRDEQRVQQADLTAA